MQEHTLAASNRGPWHAFLDETFGEFVIAERRLPNGYDGVAVQFSVFGDPKSDEDAPAPEEWERANLFAAAPAMAAMLGKAAAQFEHYEQLHRAKGTPDGNEKAETNRKLAEAIRALLAAATRRSA